MSFPCLRIWAGEVIGGDMPVDGDVTAAAGPPAWAIGLTVCGGVLLLIVILVFVRKKTERLESFECWKQRMTMTTFRRRTL